MVLPDSHRISRVPWYLGNELEANSAFVYGAVTLYRASFQMLRLADWFVTSWPPRGGAALAPATPSEKRPRAITLQRFGLFPFRSPLLGESRLLSFPGGTEMVHFPPFASHPLFDSGVDDRGLPRPGCPIRKSSGRSLLAAHRGLSQLSASFIALVRQGIHRMPLVA